MTSDDDIPVLTNVVKRERRSEPPLTPAVRDRLVAEVRARADDVAADIIDDLMTDMHIVIKDLLRAQLHERLTTLVGETIDDYISEHDALKTHGSDG
ncbi:MAG: hypothetical protein AAF004_00225 [Pseudomonadota bacterium]